MRIPLPPFGNRKCFNEQQLASYVDGAVSPAAQSDAQAHLASCARCRNAVADIVRSERLAPEQVPPAWYARVRDLGGSGRQRRSNPRWAWAGALSVVLVAGGIFAVRTAVDSPHSATAVTAASQPSPSVSSQQLPPPAPADQVRDLAARTSAPVVIAPLDGAAVAREFEVRWESVESAVAYDVIVLNQDGDPVWSKKTTSDRLGIPGGARLEDGKSYFVLVSATLPDGKTVRAKSVSFKVVPTDQK